MTLTAELMRFLATFKRKPASCPKCGSTKVRVVDHYGGEWTHCSVCFPPAKVT